MKRTALALTLIGCAIFSILTVESQITSLVKGNAIFHIGDVDIAAPENKTYYSSTLTLSYRATFHSFRFERRWIVYSLDGGRNVTVYDEYNYLEGYNGSVTLSGLSSGSHIIDVYSKNGTFAYGTSLSGGWFDTADRVYFTIDLSGETPTPTPAATPIPSTPSPEPTPTSSPYTALQLGQEVILGVTVTVAVICAGLGLLIYLIKRK